VNVCVVLCNLKKLFSFLKIKHRKHSNGRFKMEAIQGAFLIVSLTKLKSFTPENIEEMTDTLSYMTSQIKKIKLL